MLDHRSVKIASKPSFRMLTGGQGCPVDPAQARQYKKALAAITGEIAETAG
jgi:hypothetical protein